MYVIEIDDNKITSQNKHLFIKTQHDKSIYFFCDQCSVPLTMGSHKFFNIDIIPYICKICGATFFKPAGKIKCYKICCNDDEPKPEIFKKYIRPCFYAPGPNIDGSVYVTDTNINDRCNVKTAHIKLTNEEVIFGDN